MLGHNYNIPYEAEKLSVCPSICLPALLHADSLLVSVLTETGIGHKECLVLKVIDSILTSSYRWLFITQVCKKAQVAIN